jgi:hypothetical protein
MNTALTYLAASLTLAILMLFARRQHREIRDNTEIYRYPSLLRIAGLAWRMCERLQIVAMSGTALNTLTTEFKVPEVSSSLLSRNSNEGCMT